MAPAIIADFAIQASGSPQICCPATHQHVTAMGRQANSTRMEDLPMEAQSTPPSRRFKTATRIPPLTIAANAVASARPAGPRGVIRTSENTTFAATAIAAEIAGVLVSWSE